MVGHKIDFVYCHKFLINCRPLDINIFSLPMVAIAVQLICFLFRLNKTNEKIENRNRNKKTSKLEIISTRMTNVIN